MAAGVLQLELQERGMGARVRVDSAGTHASRPGRGADPRARKACAVQGINLGRCRARQVRSQVFGRFDHILAMDRQNREWLLEQSPEQYRERISLLASWAPGDIGEDIPDPYYGNQAGFDQVLSLLQVSLQGFVLHLYGQEAALQQ